ncbi:hypothetical protein Ancab_023265 [Ancistrocladus abbreviatus]
MAAAFYHELYIAGKLPNLIGKLSGKVRESLTGLASLVTYPIPERTPEGEDPAHQDPVGGNSHSYEKNKANCVPTMKARNFFLSSIAKGISQELGFTLVANLVYQPKQHGGLGLRHIPVTNNASFLKLGWSILSKLDRLRVDLVKKCSKWKLILLGMEGHLAIVEALDGRGYMSDWVACFAKAWQGCYQGLFCVVLWPFYPFTISTAQSAHVDKRANSNSRQLMPCSKGKLTNVARARTSMAMHDPS